MVFNDFLLNKLHITVDFVLNWIFSLKTLRFRPILKCIYNDVQLYEDKENLAAWITSHIVVFAFFSFNCSYVQLKIKQICFSLKNVKNYNKEMQIE